MKKTTLIVLFLMMASGVALSLASGAWHIQLTKTPDPVAETTNKPVTTPVARQMYLALLLDTSNSMDGLIDQAKSQLWNVVDEMTNAQYNGVPVSLKLALYEYGNDNLSISSGYVRQVTPFTDDLDEVSALLFALRTRGGSEYCGTVINKSLDELDWGGTEDGMRMIFIAGNESFDQGDVSFKEACEKAAKTNTVVNTIFCGPYQEGIDTFWKTGATLGGGSYMNIDMDKATVHVATPYDKQIGHLNRSLNNTYIGYGKKGAARKAQQVKEDQNAASISTANQTKRVIAKSKSHAYKNTQWDLVDAVSHKKVKLDDINEEDLPAEMQGMSSTERAQYVASKLEERKEVQAQIKTLALKRKAYVKKVQDSLAVDNELENAILKSVKRKAIENDFVFEE